MPLTIEPYYLRDISTYGLGIDTPHYLQPESVHRIDLTSGRLNWAGYARVAHCLQHNGRFIVGLDILDKTYRSNVSTADVTPRLIYDDPYKLADSPQSQWLEQTRQEIAETFRSYTRGRYTLGLFGRKMEDIINQYLRTLPASSKDDGESMRRHTARMRTNTKAHLIFVGSDYWQGVDAHVFNISQQGAGIVVSMNALRALPRMLRAELFSQSGSVKAIFGLINGPSVLWLPAIVVHLRPDDDNRLCFGGLRFEARPFQISEGV